MSNIRKYSDYIAIVNSEDCIPYVRVISKVDNACMMTENIF